MGDRILRNCLAASASRGNRPPRTHWNAGGAEWLLPTAVFVFLFKPYFDGFLKEAGKDHYQALKGAISRFWPRLFGKERLVTTTVLASAPGKLGTGPRYSHTFSLMAEGTSRQRFRLLLPDDASVDDFEASVDAFIQFMQTQHSAVEPDPHSRAPIASPDVHGVVLVAYDAATGSLRAIDYHSAMPTFERPTDSE